MSGKRHSPKQTVASKRALLLYRYTILYSRNKPCVFVTFIPINSSFQKPLESVDKLIMFETRVHFPTLFLYDYVIQVSHCDMLRGDRD